MHRKAINYDELCPEIRDAVQFLRMEGFETTDSGDGSLYREGMECAFEEPMIAITVSADSLVEDSQRLHSILRAEQVNAKVEASYSPEDEVAVIVAYGPDLVNLGTKPRELMVSVAETST